MLRVLLGVLTIAHGAVTALIWALPANDDAPFRATHSWLVGDSRLAAVAMASTAAVGFGVTGVGVLIDATWWPVAAVAAGALGLLLMVVYFNPWLIAGIAISAAVLVAGLLNLQGG